MSHSTPPRRPPLPHCPLFHNRRSSLPLNNTHPPYPHPDAREVSACASDAITLHTTHQTLISHPPFPIHLTSFHFPLLSNHLLPTVGQSILPIARRPCSNSDQTLSFGQMNAVCQFCRAKHWLAEHIAGSTTFPTFS